MKSKKIKMLTLAVIGLFAISSSAFASAPCDILKAGNKYFGKNNSKAIDIYLTVEDIDKNGKDRCTASIYSTIGTLYKMKADISFKSSNYEKASIYYKLSTKYNRAFANALLCVKEGNCTPLHNLWNK